MLRQTTIFLGVVTTSRKTPPDMLSRRVCDAFRELGKDDDIEWFAVRTQDSLVCGEGSEWSLDTTSIKVLFNAINQDMAEMAAEKSGHPNPVPETDAGV